MTFDYILRLSFTGYSYFFLIFSILHFVLGFHYAYKQIFKFKNDEADTNKTTYSENRDKFFAEYDRCNPITQEKASREYIEFLKRN